MVRQTDRNTIFCPPANIQLITNIKHITQVKNKNFLHQKYVVEGLSINKIVELTLSSRSTVKKYLREADIPIREDDRRIGRPAFGERKLGGKCVPNKSELQIIDKIIDLKAEGLSDKKIAKILHSLKIPTKRGGKWCRRTVHGILKRHK